MNIRKEKKKFKLSKKKKFGVYPKKAHTIKTHSHKKKLIVIFMSNQQFDSKVRYEIYLFDDWKKNNRLASLGKKQAVINAEKLRKELSRLKVGNF